MRKKLPSEARAAESRALAAIAAITADVIESDLELEVTASSDDDAEDGVGTVATARAWKRSGAGGFVN